MASDEFDKVELPALEQLQSLGWSYVTGEKLSPEESDERSSLKDVVLEKRLKDSIRRINPWISDENLRKVVRDLTKTVYANLVEANQSIWNSINQCVSVMQDLGRGNKGQTVHIIDFDNIENNEFLCANQFKVKGLNQDIIPDIVLFVNGLPMVVIECKSPYITNPMQEGIDQLLRYANRRNPSDDEGAETLFHYNLMMVSTHRDKARVGTITSHTEHFLEWKDPYPLRKEQVGSEPTSQEILIAGLFSRENFLDILQNFTVFEPSGGRTLKKIARYQQFRAVHRTIERIKSGENSKEKGGVIWHTQGSGKSLTMVFLTLKIRRDPELRDCKLVFLTDRIQLDNQLTAIFQNVQNETVHQADSINHLKELLSRDSSDIVTATIQKFEENVDELPVLNESEKIIVLADEAHRTQYGSLGAAISAGLPNAPRIGFTGTPLIRSQKTTSTFGSYIDTYTIEEAVEDGATVQILYEGREPAVKVTGDSLDSLFDEYFKDRSAEEREEIKKKFGTDKAVLEAPMRVRRVCMDIIKHYRESIEPNGFKAMIVTSSRNAAITYKEQLDELGAPRSAVIISADHNDGKRFWEHTNQQKHKKQIEDFKKPFGYGEGESDLSILIVKDMLLTGFDAPIAQVMYLDTRLVEHNLLQAIARVNRTGENKFRGFIVDYYGLSDYLTEALEMFSTEDVSGALIELKEEIPRLKNAHTRVMRHFHGLDPKDVEACVTSLEDETRRQNFQTDFRIFSRQMDIILPDSAAAPFLGDLKRLGKISVGARNLYRDEQLNISGAGEKVRRLIEEHVRSTGVDPKIPPVDLLAADYREKLSIHKSPRSKASEIEHAIRHHIKINLDDDPEYYRKLSERLEDIIRRHEEKWDALVQLLLDFRENIESDREKQSEESGLTPTEQPFYNILMAELTGRGEEMAMDAQTQEKVKEVTRSLVAMLDEATRIVDFFNKWDEQRRVKREIRRVVIENFDESLVKPVTDRFMELAKVKFK
ncbi:MAG: type I restriction endonuclease subunit R [Candidatus Dadabacteria bacterium]|nr:type I restriction endonuclease subunit R [Candidatus Dadabacteria bacterium]MDE0477911.1 type I restriction endonuclease subunit R [Candidatus Dadabacteria bacterium]